MGLCRVDTEKGHRQYAVRYALNDREGVAALLKDIHRLRERRFHAGDYAASDILIDLQTAIDRAKLTDRQRQSLYYVYERDLTHEESSRHIGIARNTLTEVLDRALERIAQVYQDWDYGEITLTFEERLDEQI